MEFERLTGGLAFGASLADAAVEHVLGRLFASSQGSAEAGILRTFSAPRNEPGAKRWT